MIYLFIVVFYSLPIIAVANWIMKLLDYRKAKKKNEQIPGTYSEEDMKHFKTSFIVSSILAFVAASVVIGLTVTFFMAIAYM